VLLHTGKLWCCLLLVHSSSARTGSLPSCGPKGPGWFHPPLQVRQRRRRRVTACPCCPVTCNMQWSSRSQCASVNLQPAAQVHRLPAAACHTSTSVVRQ
jgi:hypothetical protein